MEEIKIILYKAASKFNEVQIIDTSISTINDVSENDFVFIYIVTPKQLSPNSFLWLSDFRFNLVLDKYSNHNYYYTIVSDSFFSYNEKEKFSSTFNIENASKLFYKLFLNNYGMCEIELETSFENQIIYIKVGFFRVNSEKIDDVNYLLKFLLEKDVYYWESLSITRNEASNLNSNKENILWIISKIKLILNEFNTRFIPQVVNDPFTKLLPQYKVSAWSNEVTLGEESLFWLLNNSQHLESTTNYDDNRFLLQNRNYKIKTIFSEELVDGTDIPENQIIHYYISELYSYLLNCKSAIDNKIVQIGKHSDFKSEMRKSYFNRLNIILNDLANEFVKIKNTLNDYIPVSIGNNVNIELFRLDSKPHYKNIHEIISLYHLNKEAVFSHEMLFAGTNDISKLYEIFCLYRIVDLFESKFGFEKNENIADVINPFKVNVDQLLTQEVNIQSIYSFKRDSRIINIYYELLPPSLTSVVHTGVRAFRPDFIIEIIDQAISSYIILDSKYKKVGTIEKHDYEELTLKYLHGISNVNGGRFNVLGLIILIPIIGSGMNFYQRGKFSISGEHPSLPLIGRVEINVEDTEDDFLYKMLDFYLSLAVT